MAMLTKDELVSELRMRRDAVRQAYDSYYADKDHSRTLMIALEEQMLRAHRLVANHRPGSPLHGRLAEVIAMGDAMRERARSVIAELGALAADLEEGLDEPTSARRVLAHGELLDLARRLHENERQSMPAAMVAGAVLENHLRALCEGRVELGERRGRHPTLADYGMALRRADLIVAALHRQIEAWTALRNAAAHHRDDEFHAEHVQGMIDGIAALVETHPA